MGRPNPFVKGPVEPDADDRTASAPSAPAFVKTGSRKRGRRKPGKVAPAQKSLMQGGGPSRSFAGGRR